MLHHLARHSRQLFEQIIDTALDAFIVIDADGVVIAWTPQACRLFGWNHEEALGRSIAELVIPPGLRQAHAEGMARYLAGGPPHVLGRRIEIDAQHRDGRVFPVELSITAGEVDGRRIFSAALRDITHVRQTNEHAQRLIDVIESTVDFVGFAEPSGAALYINRAGRQLVGLAPDQSLDGVRIRDKYPPWAFDIVQAGIQEALQKGSWSGESGLLRADGSEIPTSQVITAHKDPAGNVKFISTIIRDMTHRYEIERALRALDRRKDEFLATLAHELRNPLAPIATSALILSQPEVDLARVQRTSEIITRQVGHMTKLLDDLLDVSRVTRGLIHLQQAPVRLVDVVQDAIEQAMPVVSAKHHALHAEPVPEALVVTGDKTRLVQVLVNLLNNAARYTPEGGNIRLDVLASGAAVLVKVSDDGIGIPADMQERIFEIFTQAQRSHGEAYGGLGLGLSLARSIAQLHGGDISAASQGPGRGSTFTFRLPLRADEESRSAD